MRVVGANQNIKARMVRANRTKEHREPLPSGHFASRGLARPAFNLLNARVWLPGTIACLFPQAAFPLLPPPAGPPSRGTSWRTCLEEVQGTQLVGQAGDGAGSHTRHSED